MPITIIEIKARSDRQAEIRALLQQHHADFKGTDHQVDTYFKVANGRLKLREGNIENHLIHYHRANQEGPKQSNVLLYKSKPGSALKEILSQANGVLVVVDKQREIYFIDNVKFHIDTVRDLGSFVEIEAIDETGDIGRECLLEQCQHYQALFGIAEADLVAVSYSDLLLAQLPQS